MRVKIQELSRRSKVTYRHHNVVFVLNPNERIASELRDLLTAC